MKRKTIGILGVLFAVLNTQAVGALAAGHSGAVSAMAYDPVNNYVLSAGMDGFLGIWDIRENSAADRFQVSPYPLRSMSLRPGKSHAALVESDGIAVYRISVWDYELKQNVFTLRFQDPVTFINYSASGNFLMVVRSGRTGLIFIHSETGEILDSPPDLSGAISFAATGKSERSMMSYAVSGRISYWELDSGKAIQSAASPMNLESPVLVGNNRYLCGVDSRGLVVVDAVSGKEIARDQSARRGTLFPIAASGLLEFMFLGSLDTGGAGALNLIHYTIGLKSTGPESTGPESAGLSAGQGTSPGNLERSARHVLPPMPLISGGVSLDAGGFALGAVDGGVWLLGASGEPLAMKTLRLSPILSAAVSGNSLAFITNSDMGPMDIGPQMGVIALDYQALRDKAPMNLEDSRGNTRISGDSGAAAGSPGNFLLWQNDTTRSFPRLISGANTPVRRDTALEKLPLRHPLRSVSLLGNQALFLDTAGTITLASTDTGAGVFTYATTAPLDIAFYDSRTIIIAQAALNKTDPFLLINTRTGETVPFIYPSAAGIKLYRAGDGRVYGGVVDGPGALTTLLLLNFPRPAASRRLLEYPGEETALMIAQSGQFLAAAIGGNGPSIHSGRGLIPFERSPSLPVELIGSDRYFIVLGKDGALSWYKNDNGSLLARLRLLEKEWVLETAEKKTELRGPINRGAKSP
ncbi:hypothetical protein FACS1894137_10700 [Spirochaetia bacterium]|nr:hypothetical protein FACS1894137_10700 [Spirochaetia bacterium]